MSRAIEFVGTAIGDTIGLVIANVDKKRIKYINKFVKRHITDERQIERVEQILGTQKKSAGLLSKLFGDLFKNNDKNKNGR